MTTLAFRAAIAVRPKEILSSNSKLAKDGIWNITLPAYRGWYLQNGNLTEKITCPSAGVCKSYCYAGVGGTYGFRASMIKHSRNLNFLMNDPFGFANKLIEEIRSKVKHVKHFRAIRFNDSGDIMDEGYWGVMKAVMTELPNVSFYAYSKRVSFLESKRMAGEWPSNFTVIYSQGGTEDGLIDPAKHRHARVFPSRAALRAAGYSDGTHTDRLAASGKYSRIGLVIHGNHLQLHKLRKRAEIGSKAWEGSHH